MIYVLVLQNSSIIQFSGWLLFGVREKTDVQTFYVLQVLSVKLLHLTTLQLSHFRVIGGSIQPKRSRKKENMQYKLYASMYKNGMQVKQEYLCTEQCKSCTKVCTKMVYKLNRSIYVQNSILAVHKYVQKWQTSYTGLYM